MDKIKSSLWFTIFTKRWYTIAIKFERKDETMAVIHLTEANFEKEVLQADIPVLVDFWRLGAARAKCWRQSLMRSPGRSQT